MELIKKLEESKSVQEAFNTTYGKDGKATLNRELTYLKSIIANTKNSANFVRNKGFENCFISIGRIKGCTLDPSLNFYYLYPIGGKVTLYIGYEELKNLFLEDPEYTYFDLECVYEGEEFIHKAGSQVLIDHTPDRTKRKSKIVATYLKLHHANGMIQYSVKYSEDFHDAYFKNSKNPLRKQKDNIKAFMEKDHLRWFISKRTKRNDKLSSINAVLTMNDEFDRSGDKKEEITINDLKPEKIDLAVEKVKEVFDAEPTEMQIIRDNIEAVTSLEEFEKAREHALAKYNSLNKEEQEEVKQLINAKKEEVSTPQPISPDEL